MKGKPILAVVILVIIIALGVFEQIYIHKIFDEFSARLESFIVEEDEVYDLDAIKETQEWWIQKHGYLELFLPHVQLIEITITYGELVGAVGAEDYDSAQALLNRLQQTSDAFADMYGISPGNVF